MQMYIYPLIRRTDYSPSLSSSLLFVGTELSIRFHYTESDCVKWYIFQEVGTQLLVAVVESILIVRGMLSIFRAVIPTDYSPIIHFSQVHALYDRNRNVTVPLVVLFLLENLAMMVTLIFVVPGVTFDATCTVIRSPPSLIIFAYGHILLTASAILILVFYSAAFVSFESVLFILTLIKFLLALRGGWGRTPVVFLIVRDGTWAFILIFGSPPLPFSLFHHSCSPSPLPPSNSLHQRRVLCRRGRHCHCSHRIPVVALDRVFRGCTHCAQPSRDFLRSFDQRPRHNCRWRIILTHRIHDSLDGGRQPPSYPQREVGLGRHSKVPTQ